MTDQTRRTFLKHAGSTAAAAAVAAIASREWNQATAAGDPTPPRRPPNILFFFPDQHRFDWTGANQSVSVRTPNLDRLAARGARLTNALTPSPLCAPARACLAAGKEYDRCRVPSNGADYPLDQTTFYTLLQRAGYHTAGCGKFDLHKASSIWGADGKTRLKEWGFSDGIDNEGKMDAVSSGAKEPKGPYMAYLKAKGLLEAHVADMRKRNHFAIFPTPLPEEAYCDNWLAQNGLDLMARFPAGKPWFLQVNFTGPHDPWDITERMDKGCRDLKTFPPPVGEATLSPEHLAVRQNYSAMVENIDRWLGVYLERLRERGDLDNTLIVWSSDHGEMLGDHAAWGKSKPWQPSVGVPLVAAGPGVAAGRVVTGPATTLDLAATFLDYAGVARPGDFDSRSLRPVLEGKADKPREAVLSGLGAWRVAFDGRYKLVTGWRADGGGGAGGAKKEGKAKAAAGGPAKAEAAPVLFDLANDRLEQTNIADKAPKEVARLMEILRKG
jgi:arylsulfatase A-like enzyme